MTTTRTFVDASVLVAIVGQEIDEVEQAKKVRAAVDPITSAIGLWEATIAVARLRSLPVHLAQEQVDEAVRLARIDIVPIGRAEARAAVDAHITYGKRNHPAKLNMGDCFAYACAKTNDAALLYKGNDFAKTDLA